MKKIYILVPLFFLSTLSAKVLISPQEAMKENYTQSTTVLKKNIVLSTKETQAIQKEAKVKLRTNKYTVFIAKNSKKTLGYGILINKKVRSRNAVILYLIENNRLKGIEIIAFNEPHEYLPSKTWQKQFQNKSTDTMLQLQKDIPLITGATLSAKSIIDASHIAFAIYHQIIQGE